MAGHFKIREVLDDVRITGSGISSPPVSVVVTNYNYEPYILDCLRSVAGQNYPSFHVVVVDDCSTDASVRLISEFIESAESRNLFELVCHDVNCGQLGAFKTGFAHARGVFVVYVDADDLLLEDFISAHISVHLGLEPVAFTSSDQYQINERDEIISGHHADLQAKGKYRFVRPGSIFRPFWTWATTSSMMFRKATLELVMPDTIDQFRICADNYISHFANLIGGSILVPEVYGCYRRHGMNCFSSNSLVGGCHPTGNMKHHPSHDHVRKTILATLLQRHDQFSAVLSEGGFETLLARVATGWEIYRASREYPGFSENRNLSFFTRITILSWSIRFFVWIGRLATFVKSLLK